ncbi:hypothetical protein VNI00_014957 [Paramarasmius palmivorus]|uniref:Acyl-CoA thioesterase-like N-terminal HotDog domain-containing protein n=1 Tax=Paramarasmius palmivorus TaxID=297713 RepID=A0AAW0BN42_9AGAR
MAPFHQAVKVDFLRKEGDIDIYGGVVDGEWCVGVVPNGGFVLGLVVEACIKRQVRTNHPDPVHVTAHFLRATAALAPFEVHIHQLKTGRGFTNLIADLIKNVCILYSALFLKIQLTSLFFWQGVVKITTHQYFGDLTTDSTKNASPFHLTLAPPSPYARRLPLHQHPSKAPLRTLHEAFKYSKFFKASSEPEIAARNAPDSTIRSGSETIGGNGIEWGQWATLTDDGDTLTRPLIAFMVDMITPPATLLPKSEKPNMPDAR